VAAWPSAPEVTRGVRMQASARLVATADASGSTRLTTVSSAPPLVLRRTGPARPVAEVHLVGGAAGPLAGDRLRLDVELGPGARLRMRTVAASVALPGVAGAWSRFDVTVRLGEEAELAWLPEPLVAGQGCRHRLSAQIEVAAGGRLTWRDELVCGRHGEAGGDVVSAVTVGYAGRPLLAHELAVGPGAPGWDGPAVLGGAQSAGSLLLTGPGWPGEVAEGAGPDWAVLPLAGPGVLVTAVAADALTLRRRLERADLTGGPISRAG